MLAFLIEPQLSLRIQLSKQITNIHKNFEPKAVETYTALYQITFLIQQRHQNKSILKTLDVAFYNASLYTILIKNQMYQEEYQEACQSAIEYQCDQYYQDYGYEILDRLSSLDATDQPYGVYDFPQTVAQIYQENQQKSCMTSLPPSWNLMLYSFCEFSNDKLLNMIDQDQIGRNIVLRYSQSYSPLQSEGECLVCLSQCTLLSNPCGHSFCYSCWQSNLQLHHTDRNHYELFPNCQWQGCFHKTNLILMEKIWERTSSMRQKFDRLLCLRYTQKSSRAILCANQTCNKTILINYPTKTAVTCRCSANFCRFCKQADHSPLACTDVQLWANLVQNKEDLWMNEIITQKCPMCKTPIDKNGGCVHMTCICRYEFCWICLKVWKGHSSFYVCSEMTRENHEERLREEQERKRMNEGDYSAKFEESKSEVERNRHIIKRLKEIDFTQLEERTKSFFNLHGEVINDLLRLKEIRSYLLDVLSFELNSQIYIFFELPGFKKLRQETQRFSKRHSELDDYLAGKFKMLQSPWAEGKQLSTKNIEGVTATIKLRVIQGRDHYNQMFKILKRQFEGLKSCAFMEQCER